MAARGSGGVINVSSVAAFLPRGTYSAAKAWVNSFSEWAANEYRAAGRHRDDAVPRLHQDRVPRADGASAAAPGFLWLDADFLVSEALADFDKGQALSVPGAQYKAITAAARLVPTRLSQRLQNIGRK